MNKLTNDDISKKQRDELIILSKKLNNHVHDVLISMNKENEKLINKNLTNDIMNLEKHYKIHKQIILQLPETLNDMQKYCKTIKEEKDIEKRLLNHMIETTTNLIQSCEHFEKTIKIKNSTDANDPNFPS